MFRTVHVGCAIPPFRLVWNPQTKVKIFMALCTGVQSILHVDIHKTRVHVDCYYNTQCL